MTYALIGALMAGAVGVWTLVVVKLVQQRRARLQRERQRAQLDEQLPGLPSVGDARSSQPGSTR